MKVEKERISRRVGERKQKKRKELFLFKQIFPVNKLNIRFMMSNKNNNFFVEGAIL